MGLRCWQGELWPQAACCRRCLTEGVLHMRLMLARSIAMESTLRATCFVWFFISFPLCCDVHRPVPVRNWCVYCRAAGTATACPSPACMPATLEETCPLFPWRATAQVGGSLLGAACGERGLARARLLRACRALLPEAQLAGLPFVRLATADCCCCCCSVAWLGGAGEPYCVRCVCWLCACSLALLRAS
jgi:hypothetical protein